MPATKSKKKTSKKKPASKPSEDNELLSTINDSIQQLHKSMEEVWKAMTKDREDTARCLAELEKRLDEPKRGNRNINRRILRDLATKAGYPQNFIDKIE